MTAIQRRRALDAMTSESLAATAAVRGRLLGGRPYVGPVGREHAFTSQMRAVRSGAPVVAGDGAGGVPGPLLWAGAGPGLGAGLTHGLDLTAQDLAHGHPLGPALRPTGDGRHLGKKGGGPGGGARVAVSFSHDGVYGPAVGGGGAPLWSCCGAADRDSRGCHAATRSLDRHMYDSPW